MLEENQSGQDPKASEYEEVLNSLVDTNHLNITKTEDGRTLRKAEWIVSLNQA